MQIEGNNYFVRDNEVIILYIANKNREVKYKHSNAIIINYYYNKFLSLKNAYHMHDICMSNCFFVAKTGNEFMNKYILRKVDTVL
jgi:hypothetical protein